MAMPSIPNLLPQPFEWCHIPAGETILAHGEWHLDDELGENDELTASFIVHQRPKVHVDAFFISKYPITNAQYAIFIHHADGYRNPIWWDFSDEARLWRGQNPDPNHKINVYADEGNVFLSTNPSDARFTDVDHPQINITWYEAMAFCRWLSAQAGLSITLPTDAQWVRAARGDIDRLYAWGDELDPTYANYHHHIGHTTPVTAYPKGVSLFGVMDMCGNVSEWCFINEADVLYKQAFCRGGCWSDTPEKISLDIQFMDITDNFSDAIGFRIAYIP